MIRKMKLSDLDQIMMIENDLFTSPWKKSDYEYEIKSNPYSKYYVLEENSVIIGYIGIWIIFDIAQITTIGVSKDYQGNGLSNILINKAIEEANSANCDNISLEVRVSNDVAISLYKKHGFINVNTRKAYYSDNFEDAYLMVKPLGGNNE